MHLQQEEDQGLGMVQASSFQEGRSDSVWRRCVWDQMLRGGVAGFHGTQQPLPVVHVTRGVHAGFLGVRVPAGSLHALRGCGREAIVRTFCD